MVGRIKRDKVASKVTFENTMPPKLISKLSKKTGSNQGSIKQGQLQIRTGHFHTDL